MVIVIDDRRDLVKKAAYIAQPLGSSRGNIQLIEVVNSAEIDKAVSANVI